MYEFYAECCCEFKHRYYIVTSLHTLYLQPHPVSDAPQDFPLAPSDVYAAYCDPTQLVSPCSLTSTQWCRARLLRVEPGSSPGNRQVVVLAVDYGFTMTLPQSRLALLPPQCRGIPPQVPQT